MEAQLINYFDLCAEAVATELNVTINTATHKDIDDMVVALKQLNEFEQTLPQTLRSARKQIMYALAQKFRNEWEEIDRYEKIFQAESSDIGACAYCIKSEIKEGLIARLDCDQGEFFNQPNNFLCPRYQQDEQKYQTGLKKNKKVKQAITNYLTITGQSIPEDKKQLIRRFTDENWKAGREIFRLGLVGRIGLLNQPSSSKAQQSSDQELYL